MKFTAAIVAFATTALAQQNCAAAGTTDSQGRYSCNPAHQYPEGQTCQAGADGCFWLNTGSANGVPTSTAVSGASVSTDVNGVPISTGYTTLSSPVVVGPTPVGPTPAGVTPSPGACPAAGSTDSQGRYSCNPAHQYPEGQSCDQVDGCYYLNTGNGVATSAPTAGAGSLQAAGGLAVAIFGMFLL